MVQSKHYLKVSTYFATGVWTLKMVANAVKKNWITPDEYKEITGEKYQEE